MTNVFTESPKTEHQRNIELLRGRDELFAKAYDLAVESDSRLADVVICLESSSADGDIIKDLNKNRAERPWETESGKAEIHVLFRDGPSPDEIMKAAEDDTLLEGLLKSLIGSAGIDENSLTGGGITRLYGAYMLLHELGHASDAFDNINNQDAYDERIKQALWEYNAPIREKRQLRQKEDAEFSAVIAMVGKISSEEEFAKRLDDVRIKYTELRESIELPPDEMRKRYGALPHEQFADNFAVSVLTSNPEFLRALITL
jgi:hypothetical protein